MMTWHLGEKAFWQHCGDRREPAFSSLPQMVSTLSKMYLLFWYTLNFMYGNVFNLDKSSVFLIAFTILNLSSILQTRDWLMEYSIKRPSIEW